MFFGLGLTTSSTATVISLHEGIRSAFASRVLDAGGTIEGNSCLRDQLRVLTQVHPDDIKILSSFQRRVIEGGGRVSDESCLETELASLLVAQSKELKLVKAFVERVNQDGGLVQDNFGAVEELERLEAIS